MTPFSKTFHLSNGIKMSAINCSRGGMGPSFSPRVCGRQKEFRGRGSCLILAGKNYHPHCIDKETKVGEQNITYQVRQLLIAIKIMFCLSFTYSFKKCLRSQK